MERPMVNYKKLFINNEFVNSLSGKTLNVIDPATDNTICQVQAAGPDDVDVAVKAAKAAFVRNAPWRTMDASERGRLLYRLADAIADNLNYLTALEALDVGKPIDSAKGNVEFAVNTIRYFAGYADKIHGKVIPVDGKAVCYTRREPVGIVAAIIPWNYPICITALKVAAALSCGCTLVLKPSEEAPLSAIFLGKLILDIGFPPGVVNIVPGYGETAGAALASHPDVTAVSFTGSVNVGQSIMQAASATMKRISLELGGKSPLIIFADADLDKAAEVAFDEVMENSGQCCVAATRTYVEAAIYEEMVARFRKLALARTLGDPFTTGVEQGPQISQVQFDTVMRYIQSGVAEGARLVAGGNRHGSSGFFIQPTVFADVTEDMRVGREEIFGPVQVVLKFDSLEEVVDRANATKYGLGAGVFTRDLDKATRVAQVLEAGTVWINSYNKTSPQQPFGGYKSSGIGREQGKYGLEFYTEVKTISMAMSIKNS